jgi:hypothetical protein
VRVWAVVLGVIVVGCGPREPVDLIDNEAWTLADAADDPFADERPEGAECAATGFGFEAPVFEVETELCNYGTFTQPLAADVLEGDTVRMIAAHLPLISEDGGEGVLALQAGPASLEYRVDIPADEHVLRPRTAASADIPAGTPVFLHVRNHGANSWQLLDLQAGPASAFGEVE